MLITIEQLEALASQIERDDSLEHARLLRLCRSMLRILAARQPEIFVRRATSITDVAGHWDNSFPPKAEYHFDGGSRRLFTIRPNETEDVPTEGGFYHTWRRQTSEQGCYVGRDGHFYGCEETGTGAVGQYAAHPGDENRDITLAWVQIVPTLDDLRETEPMLRGALAAFLAAA